MVPSNSILVRPIFVEIALTKDSGDIPRRVDVAEPAPNGVLLAQLLIDANVVAVGILRVQQGLRKVPLCTGCVRRQRPIEQFGHSLHVGIDKARRQFIARGAQGLVLQFRASDQGLRRTSRIATKRVPSGGRAVRVVDLTQCLALSIQSEIPVYLCGSRYENQVGIAFMATDSLIAAKEKRPVSSVVVGQDNWTGDVSSKLIQVELVDARDGVLGIQRAIAEKFPSCTMELVRARFCDHINGPT